MRAQMIPWPTKSRGEDNRGHTHGGHIVDADTGGGEGLEVRPKRTRGGHMADAAKAYRGQPFFLSLTPHSKLLGEVNCLQTLDGQPCCFVDGLDRILPGQVPILLTEDSRLAILC